MYSLVRSIIRALTTDDFRFRVHRARKAWNLKTPMILQPTYADDGLISQHICEFLTEPRFQKAYAIARRGIPWSGPNEIHFRAYIACWAAEHALNLDGDFVECGVATGVMSRAICDYIDFENAGKFFYLYDTFKGVPVETLNDKNEIALANRFNKLHYANDLLPIITERFRQISNVKIIPGILPQALAGTAPEKIAYLSIDMNNAPAEIGAIEFLWSRLVIGALVLLDDYSYGPEFINQKREWDRFAASKKIGILTLPTGQGLLIKQ